MGNKIFVRIKEFFSNHYFGILVIAVVAFAFLLRYFHTKTGLPYLYHWDEPQTASTALKIMKTGDYNPHFFDYGSMMIYSNFVVDILHYLSLMGHPTTSESYLTNLNDIKINADTGWHWTISHPSFYRWNRILTTILGTGTVFVTYLIGRHVFNKWIGLIAAFFLATLSFHISHSAWITTDVPVGFFVLTTVLFSILFIKYKKLSYFILSLIFSGMAIATKYNAALSILIPLLTLIWVYIQSRDSVKVYMWFLIPTVPVIVFFLIMPYAIIDLTTFLEHVGYEVNHYKIQGHGGATSIPGWEHFSFQMHQFYRNIGFENTIVIILGILGILFRPLFMFILLLPIFYIWYMTGMKVNFHRNFIQVYPFIALLFASGFYYLYYIFEVVRKRFMSKREWISIALVTIVISIFFIPQGFSSFKTGITKYHAKDTRTNVINELNALKGIQHVVIAKELRIHTQDLRKLKLPYSIIPLLSISSKRSDKTTLYVLPSNITSFHRDRNKKKLEPMKRFISAIDKSFIVKKVGGNGGTRVDIYSVNPGILLVKNLPVIPIEINVDKPITINFEMLTLSKPYRGKPLRMVWNGSVTTPVYSLKPNSYKLVVNTKGVKYTMNMRNLKYKC